MSGPQRRREGSEPLLPRDWRLRTVDATADLPFVTPRRAPRASSSVARSAPVYFVESVSFTALCPYRGKRDAAIAAMSCLTVISLCRNELHQVCGLRGTRKSTRSRGNSGRDKKKGAQDETFNDSEP